MFPISSSRRDRLRWLSRFFNKRHSKWFAATEQSGSSASNFLVSLMILGYSGVAKLGEYGFWFALCGFSTLMVAGFAVNQMVLHVADSSILKQRAVMTTTFVVVVLLQILPGTFLWWAVASRHPSDSVFALAVPVIVYTAMYNFAELVRQFLYMRRRQRLSLFYAAFSTMLAVLVFAFIVYVVKPPSIIEPAFWCLAAAQFGYVAMASLSGRAWKFGVISNLKLTLDTLKFYWTHGRVAASGMLVMWAQNKSVNPMLVLMIDTVAAGFYQIARMIVMPINMITLGIARSAMAEVRRAWGLGNKQALKGAIGTQLRTSMIVVFLYLLLVGIGFLVVKLFDVREIQENFLLVFLSAVIVVILSNYRYWLSQYLAVQLQFGFLLKIGCFAAIFSLLWMLVAGMFLESAALVVFGSAVGELYMLNILRKRYHQRTGNP